MLFVILRPALTQTLKSPTKEFLQLGFYVSPTKLMYFRSICTSNYLLLVKSSLILEMILVWSGDIEFNAVSVNKHQNKKEECGLPQGSIK